MSERLYRLRVPNSNPAQYYANNKVTMNFTENLCEALIVSQEKAEQIVQLLWEYFQTKVIPELVESNQIVKNSLIKTKQVEQLNNSIDELHSVLKQLPEKPKVATEEYEIRKEVLLALHHAAWALNLIEQKEVEQSDKQVVDNKYEVQELFGSIKNLIENTADFSNGNQHQGFDEGNVYGWQMWKTYLKKAYELGILELTDTEKEKLGL